MSSGGHLFVAHFCAAGPRVREMEKSGVVPVPLWRPEGPVLAELTVDRKQCHGGAACKP